MREEAASKPGGDDAVKAQPMSSGGVGASNEFKGGNHPLIHAHRFTAPYR